MAKSYTISGANAAEVKQSRGTPTKTFDPESGMSRGRKNMQNRAGTIICAAITIRLLIYFYNKFDLLGREMFRDRNKRGLLRILLPLLSTRGFASSLKEGTKVHAEFYPKGFRIKTGNKEYAYEYKDIKDIKRSIWMSDPIEENSVRITLTLISGEKVEISRDNNNTLLNISKMLLDKHADAWADEIFSKYEKGDTIDFGRAKVNSSTLDIQETPIPREEIGEMRPKKGDSRELQVFDVDGNKIGVIYRDSLTQEKLFTMILDEEEIPYK